MDRYNPEADSEYSSRARTQRSLNQIKRGRKHAENEAFTLANRIALLKKEEAKIWNNVGQAKLRAKEAYLSQRRGEDSSNISDDSRYQSHLQYNPPYNHPESASSLEIRKQRDSGIQLLQEILRKQKHQEMLAIKKQSDLIMMNKRDFEMKIKQEKQSQMLAVKKQELLANFKKKAYFDEKHRRLRQNHQKQLEDEEEKKVLKELEILDLQKAEMELVQRVQKTRKLQKQVYQDINSLYSEPPENQLNGYYHPPSTKRTTPESRSRVLGGRGKSLDARMISSFDEQENLSRLGKEKNPYPYYQGKNNGYRV